MPTSGARRRAAKRFGQDNQPRRRTPFPRAQPPHVRPGRHHFWLVQCLERPNRADAGELFNGVFAAAYMGSVEFQYEAIPETLQRIRGAGVVIRSCRFEHRGVTREVYFVGPKAGMNSKIADFRTWLENPLASKDRTDFSEIFRGVFPTYEDPHSRKRPSWLKTCAWLSLQDDIGFTFTPKTARKLKRALA